nr:hypothetical protein CFP56_24282 [Quercus suber]
MQLGGGGCGRIARTTFLLTCRPVGNERHEGGRGARVSESEAGALPDVRAWTRIGRWRWWKEGSWGVGMTGKSVVMVGSGRIRYVGRKDRGSRRNGGAWSCESKGVNPSGYCIHDMHYQSSCPNNAGRTAFPSTLLFPLLPTILEFDISM